MRVVWELLNVALSLFIGYWLGFFLIVGAKIGGMDWPPAAYGALSLASMGLVVYLRWQRRHRVPNAVIGRRAPSPGD